MAGKENQQHKQPPQESFRDLLLRALGDLTSRANCDQFSIIRGNDDSFKWYDDWPQLQKLVTDQLLSPPSLLPKSQAPPAVQPAELSILVARCGSSKLSEYLVGAGFELITNVDFSEVVIMDTLTTSNGMKRRVLFPDKTFDAIVDKGGLDALMVPALASTSSPVLHIHKVKRILKPGGKYICLTLAESHVLDILFKNFRFGWKMSIYAISKEPSSGKLKPQTFMVVVEKDSCASVYGISTFLDGYDVESHGDKAHEFHKALEREQKFRREYCGEGCDKFHSLKELNLGNLKVFEPGRRIKLILGDPEGVHFYKSVLVDAQQDSKMQFAVYIVPRNRVDEWLFSSEEGHKLVAAKSTAARSLIILLDSCHYPSSLEYTEVLSNCIINSLARQLAPIHWDVEDGVPVVLIDELFKQRAIVHQVTSTLTGPIIVDEVIYRNDDNGDHVFRRLTFGRSAGIVESQALLYQGEVQTASGEGSSSHEASSDERKVDHFYLAQPYQNAMISGLMLIWPHLRGFASPGSIVQTVIIGLGGGSLPMYMKTWLPTSLNIEVVELDPVVLDVAKTHFGFTEHERLRVRIGDGIDFVREKAESKAEGESSSRKLDILIVDVNFPNLSSGLTFPSAAFGEESFLQNAKNSLSEEGLFIINVVCWSSTSRARIYSSLKKVFGKILLFKGDDAHEVVFALKKESQMMTKGDLSEACNKLERSVQKVANHKWIERIITASKMIRPLK